MIHVIDTVLVTSDFTLQNVNKDEEIAKTRDVGLLPYALIGIMSINGYSLVNRKGK